MNELLGNVMMLVFWGLLGTLASYVEERKATKRQQAEELLEMQARYVLWSKEQAIREAAEKMAEERKRCTPSFKY